VSLSRGRAAREQVYRSRGLRTDERIGWKLTRAAERWPDRPAILCDGVRLTYRDLERWTTAVACRLTELGLQPRQRLLWQLPNSIEAIVLHMAAWRIGVLCVPVVPAYREHELGQILDEVRPTAVAFAATHGSRAPAEEMDALLAASQHPPAHRIIVGGSRAGWVAVTQRPGDGDTAPPAVELADPLPPDEPCLILFTSGTTARPKGAVHTSASLVAEAATLRDAMGFSYHDVLITGAPVTHIGGLLVAVIIPSSCGARAILLTAWDPARAATLTDEEGATFSMGPTVFLQGFVEQYEASSRHAHRLPTFMCGGAAIAPALIERAERVGIRAFRSWGMTELPTIGIVGPDDSLELRATRDGRLSEGCEAQAVDGDRNPLAAGSLGELRVRGPEQMLGYTDATVTAAQVDDEGWFYTGDVGAVDGDGWVTMTGRLKDVINRGGEKFSAQDIENAICSHPSVGAVAVTGVPEPRLGEAVAAFVVLRQGQSWPGREALLRHLEDQRLARQKLPVHWRVIPELPMTLSGKVQKNRLLDQWTATLEQAPEPG
jgi:acyl-CoA synthetase (AMP-forming)/AMP-acid ligase II